MVELAPLPEGTLRYPPELLQGFIVAALRAADVPQSHARLTAEVLVSADLRGIRSHGAARLPHFMHRLERGIIKKDPRMTFHAGSDTTGVLDADNGLGTVASDRAMEEALSMAGRHGSGFVAVRNSSHFGYAGYWSQKAMERGFIGICMSKGGRFVTPTFGVEPILGTNPVSVAIPGGPGGHSFHLDMATSAVARGKVESSLREGRPIPKGWLPEAVGRARLDERGLLPGDVPLLPLGGEGQETGGHKGYSLSLMVALLCGALSGSSDIPPSTAHFMGAIKVEGFREPALVHAQMAETFGVLRNAKKAPGHDRIYIAGEPEAIAEAENRRLGIPITPAVLEQLRRLNDRLGLGFEL